MLTAVDLKTGWKKEFPPINHKLQPNSSTDLALQFPCPHPPIEEASDRVAPSCTVVVQAKLVAKDDPTNVLSRMSDWPQPYKFWTPPKPHLQATVDGEKITITADTPVKGVVFSVAEDLETVFWSDNGVRKAHGITYTWSADW
jgi:beta-mannosidase